jgi:phenylacetate-CoA ligase
MLQKLRGQAFWLKDRFKGGQIRRHYNEVKFHIENYHLEASRQYRREALENLLAFATENTPYYREFKNHSTLVAFPVINKNVVREHYDAFKSSVFHNSEDKYAVVTSGSTGTPFKLWHDVNKRKRNTAEIIYFSERAGYCLGAQLLYVKVWNDINRKSPLKQFMENIVPLDVFNYSDEDIHELIKVFNKVKQPSSIVAFGSTLETLLKHLENSRADKIRGNIISIIANSDSLSNPAKDGLARYFGVSPMSRYSNMENGMLAQQFIGSGYNFEVNWASFFIEILELNSNKPVKYGEKGRVVITDLFNYCMPLIRYETGDLAIMDTDPDNPQRAPFLKSIEGRKVDALYDTKGNLVTSHIVTVNMWKYDELKQYQFVQWDHGKYEFILNPIDTFTRERELVAEFKGYLGENADIGVRYVDEIPLLDSGKRRLLVNKMIEGKN